MQAILKCDGQLNVKLIRAGKVIEERVSICDFDLPVKQTWWEHLKAWIRRAQGIVTNAGVYYLATDFASGQASPHISAMNYHDCGTGTTAAQVTDTGLQTPYGGARATGTQSNPSNGVYKTIGTISFSSSLAITEWGLFSATSSGTLWDHRIFSAVNVNNGDSIQFTYQLTVPSGGS